MGIVQSGTVDIDALYNAFAPRLGYDEIPISIPKIATIKIGREELEILLRCIKEV